MPASHMHPNPNPNPSPVSPISSVTGGQPATDGQIPEYRVPSALQPGAYSGDLDLPDFPLAEYDLPLEAFGDDSDDGEYDLLLDDLASDVEDYTRSDEDGWFYSDED